jgi:hypothetical protein
MLTLPAQAAQTRLNPDQRVLLAQKKALVSELKKEKRILLGFKNSRGLVVPGQLYHLNEEVRNLTDVHTLAVAGELIAEVGRVGERILTTIILKKFSGQLGGASASTAATTTAATTQAATKLDNARKILKMGMNILNGYQAVDGLLGDTWKTRTRLLELLNDPDSGHLNDALITLEARASSLDTRSLQGFELLNRVYARLESFDFAAAALNQQTSVYLNELESKAAQRKWWEYLSFVQAQDEGDYVRAVLVQKQALLQIQELRFAFITRTLRQLNL